MHRLSDNASGQRKKARESIEDANAPANEKRADWDASSKWTLVQLPFRIFYPVLQTSVFFRACIDVVSDSYVLMLSHLLAFSAEIQVYNFLQVYQKFQRCQAVHAAIKQCMFKAYLCWKSGASLMRKTCHGRSNSADIFSADRI
jgi:hypothetical protein